ncbi:MAG: PQQ-binding-like beta-propeller repeat protein [Verrucomicrobiales bacterium]|nr:PQQ-binding-like beta-propeller repeat protein [Verrucomicrobiales bacterium]
MKRILLPLLTLPVLVAVADEWPTWGHDETRNMISSETGLVDDFEPGERVKGSEEIDMATTKNCLWAVKLGSQSYGSPNVAGGRILIGTNNEVPRNSAHEGDRGIVMSLDEKTGAFQWQLVVPKLGAGKVSDWEYLGICSTPTVVGNTGYVITNRCEVVAIDLEGFSNGNQGMQEEDVYMAGLYEKFVLDPATVKREDLYKPGDQDSDILWVYDMRGELGVFPHNVASSYPLFIDGKLFVTTSNGVDWSHLNIPSPQAPSLICLDPETGELLGEQAPLGDQANWDGSKILHCSWSSAAGAKVGGKTQVFFGAGNGWAYGLSTETVQDDEGFDILKENWRYDGNDASYRKNEDGEWNKYAEYDGPSEIIATPVYYDGYVYVAIGQDPEHGEGVGRVSCIDPNKSGDQSGKAVWTFTGIERSISTPSIADDLLYIADYTGRLFCIDAKTGAKYWEYDTKGHIWGSTLVADGKVYLGNEEGELTILKAGKELEKIAVLEFPAPIYSSPVAANGVLYVETQTHLYAFGKK